jgi:Zn-dependent peptidase ImmA (M78 family)
VQVLERPLRFANELWLPEHNTIVLKSAMRPAHQRNALAHGIGHAVLGHTDDRPKHERQADRYAAAQLIDPRELLELSVWSQDLGRIATELGVTRRLLLAYLG